MYEGIPAHIWGPDTQADPTAPESLAPTGQLIDRNDPALTEILQAVVALSSDLGHTSTPDEDMVKMAIRLGRARHARMQAGAEPPRGAPARESTNGHVYYVRRGAMVKIGTTTDLYRRMSALLPEEVLAIEPGSHAREHELHRQFAVFRVPGQREWFHASRQIQEHVEQVLDRHGPPPSDLPTLPAAAGMLEA